MKTLQTQSPSLSVITLKLQHRCGLALLGHRFKKKKVYMFLVLLENLACN